MISGVHTRGAGAKSAIFPVDQPKRSFAEGAFATQKIRFILNLTTMSPKGFCDQFLPAASDNCTDGVDLLLKILESNLKGRIPIDTAFDLKLVLKCRGGWRWRCEDQKEGVPRDLVS